MEIKIYPDAVLRNPSKPVMNLDGQVIKLIDAMAETMYCNRGIGLAAPQLGSLNQIMIANLGEGLLTLINPQIMELKGEESISGEEGCLSVPGITVEIKRNKKIVVKGTDREGKEVFIEAEDLLARVIQHEIDHLNGILIIDRISKVRRQLISGKLKELRRQAM